MKTYTVQWSRTPTRYNPVVTSQMTASDMYMANAKYNEIGLRFDRATVVERVFELMPDGSRLMHFENRHLALHHRISEELREAVKGIAPDVWAD